MKRHDLDLVSMVFGLVFLLYASLWPLWRLEILDQDNLSWLPATALIVIGVLGLALSIARSRTGSQHAGADDDELPMFTSTATRVDGSDDPIEDGLR